MNNDKPKRRKSKDNPYTIFYSKETDKYYLSFQDGQMVRHRMEIDKTFYDLFDGFELEDLSELNEFDRHIEHSDLTEFTLNRRAVDKPKTTEDIAYEHIRNEQLHEAISELPEIQKRRLLLYYFGDFTYEQIAKMEGCTARAVEYSVCIAKRNLRKKLNYF